MTKRRSDNPESHSLRAKKERGQTRNVNHKFDEEHHKVAPIQGKTEFQKKTLKALKTKQIVVLLAPAGVGKSYLTMAQAADWFVNGDIDKIVIARTAVGMGKTHGYLKGDLESKYTPFLMPLIEVFTNRYGQGKYETALSAGNIEMIATEHLRGRNLYGVTILDEAQNSTPEEMFSIVTRVTEEGKLFIIGDPTQKDLKAESGLEWLKTFVEKHNLQEYIEIVVATSDDIVRGGLCKAFVKAKEKELEEKQQEGK
jgi:phosphate starvation-inducible PhoH-like protein